MLKSKLRLAILRRFHMLLCLMVLWYIADPSPALGYHFFYIKSSGSFLVLKWRNVPVNFSVDGGPTNILPTMQTAIDTWNNVGTAQNVFGTLTRASVDFTADNFRMDWGNLTGDGQQEMVLDEDGRIFALLRLDPSIVLGMAFMNEVVVGGQGVINDAMFVINGSAPLTDILPIAIHELGHVQGLAHSSVGMHNSASFSSDALDPVNISRVPTMHPFLDGDFRSLEADDKAGLSELYPEGGLPFGSSIEGTVTRCFSNEAVTGANVRVINTSDSSIQISRFSGFDGNSDGRYIMRFLPSGSYKLVVEPMGANDFFIGRFRGSGGAPTSADGDFNTEYFNPPDEDNCTEEIPDMPVNVSISAGSAALNKNFKVGGVDLAFVVDDTGSMSPEIGAVRTILSGFVSILDNLNRTLGTPFPSVAIVTFKDDVTKRLVSKDPARLQAVINSLFASGGGDCPESSNAALLTAGRLLRRGGVATLFTDADSRPDGPSREAVTNLYRSRSARAFTLLSGSCSGSISSPLVQEKPFPGQTQPGGSNNLELFPPPATLGFEDSVRTFSEISLETGGFFTAIPGIKTGNPIETQRYINTGTNLAVSSAVPAIGLTTPGDGPQGATLNIEIAGSNTNFQASSQLSFSGGQITVNSLTATSPVRIVANISIPSGATTGFRDVIITTNLGGNSVETATGKGAFQVVSSPVSPTIISVSPSRGAQGETLNVAISGASTHFVDGTSLANFGSGITVNSTRVSSSTSLVANITIINTAVIGFRDVRVITGGETANENVVGPFLVAAPPSPIPRIASINPSEGSRGQQTFDVTITGANTNFVNGDSSASFSGTGITVNNTTVTSPTSAIANISIAADATLGFRDVFVTTVDEVAAILSAFQVKGEEFNFCVQDDISGSILKVNSSTGAYQFIDCRKGTTVIGRGVITTSFCKIQLLDTGPDPKHPDRRVSVLINPCTGRGDASISILPGQTVTLGDSNIANNTCACR